MRREIIPPAASHSEPTIESQSELDIISLMTTTVALFGLALVSVLSLLNIING